VRWLLALAAAIAAALLGAQVARAWFSSGEVTQTNSFTAAPVDHLTIDPSSAPIVSGGSQTYTITAWNAAGTQSWPVTQTSTLSITPDGSCAGATCTASVAGPHTVRAGFWGLTVTAGLTVKPAPTALAASAATGTYGGSTALSATLTSGGNPVSGETVAFTLNGGAVCGDAAQPLCPVTGANGVASLPNAALGSIGAGAYANGVGAFFAGDSTYASTNGSALLTVNPAPLSFTFNPTMIYGSAPALNRAGPGAEGIAFTGFVGSDGPSVVGGTTNACTIQQTGTGNPGVGGYTISGCTGFSAANYQITFGGGSLTVTPATLIVTCGSASMTYGGSMPFLNYGITGFVNGDPSTVVSGVPTCTTTGTSSSPAGTYPITAGAGTLSAQNYAFAFVGGTLTVSPASLTITAAGKQITYGGALPSFTWSANFVGGDTASSLTTAPTCAPTNAGPYTVASSPYTIHCSGAVDSNYAITYADGQLTVGRATLTVTPNSGQSMTYGGATVPPIAFTIGGFATGEGGSVLTSQPSCSTATTPFTGTAGSGSPVGHYAISCSGGSSANYSFSYNPTNVTFAVMPAPLTITCNNASMTYGGTVPALTSGITGFVNGDTSGAVSGTPACTTMATSASPANTYPITASPGTLSAQNYTFVLTGGTLTIGQAPLTFTVNATMTYGGAVPLNGLLPGDSRVSFTSFVNRDTASAVGGQTSGCVVGSATPGAGSWAITGCSGFSSSNYKVSFAGGTLTVNKAALTVTARNQSITWPGDFDHAFDASSVSVLGLVNGDTLPALNGAISSPYVAGSNHAGTYPLIPAITDGNYNATLTDGTLTVSPTGPVVSWSQPAAISYGTALSGTQLDATASFNGSNVTGTFTYTPAAGTVLNAGKNQTLSVSFMPGDSTDFTGPITQTTTITVAPDSPALAVSAPKTGSTGALIAPTAITATLTGGYGETGTISFAVFGPSSSPPTSCATGGANLGSASVSGNGGYHPAAGFLPLTAGNYWWYASYGGDGNNSGAGSACGAGMAETQVGSGAPGLLWALDPAAASALSTTGAACIQVGGNIYVDSTSASAISKTGNGCKNLFPVMATGGGSIFDRGGWSSGCCSPSPTGLGSPVPDPLAGLVLPAYSGGKWSAGGSTLSSRAVTSTTLNPGVYAGGISLTGNGAYTMNPGVYVLDGGSLKIKGSASLSGSGVFIYNSSSATPSKCQAVTLGGGSRVTLTSATSGAYQGVVFAQDRRCATGVSVGGNGTLSLDGALYAPDAPLTLTGTSCQAADEGMIVADTVSVVGNGQIKLQPADAAHQPQLSAMEGAAVDASTSPDRADKHSRDSRRAGANGARPRRRESPRARNVQDADRPEAAQEHR